MKATLKDLTMNRDGTQNVTVTVEVDFRNTFDRLKNKPLDITIKKHTERRSLDANAFCWSLCTDIGRSITPPVSKEAVYRKAIKDIGEYEPLPIKNEAVEKFGQRWSSNGVGWFTENRGECRNTPGYTLVYAYYGSSTYDTKAMSRLIDYLIDDAEQLGVMIPLGKKDVERLKGDWRIEAVTAKEVYLGDKKHITG